MSSRRGKFDVESVLKKNEEQVLSADELRRELYKNFLNSGISDSLKSHLRIQLVEVLRNYSQRKKEPPSLLTRAINSIFMLYLQNHSYSYTLSVFMPECGMSNTEPLSREDVITVLHLDKLPIAESLSSPDNEEDLIWTIFKAISKPMPRKVEKEVQTDKPDESITKKLQGVEEHFTSLTVNAGVWQNFEERMIKYQREVDERGKQELESQINRFKETELNRVKLEEASKYREMISKEREDMEKKMYEKADRLRTREIEMEQAFKKKEVEMGKIEYEERQHFLKEMESLRMREENAKKEKELATKNLRMQQERLAEREEAVNVRLDEAHRLVDQMRSKYDADLTKFKADYLKAHEEERMSIQKERGRLDEDLKRFLMEKEPHSRMYEKIKELEEELKVSQHRLQVSQEYSNTIKAQMENMEKDIQHIRGIDDLTLRSSSKGKFDRTRIAMSLVDSTTSLIGNPIDEISKLRDLLQQEKEAKERLESENMELLHTLNELKDLQEIRDQDMQDLIDDHKTELQIEKDKVTLFEKDSQKEKERLKDELKRETETRKLLQRRLDDCLWEMEKRKISNVNVGNFEPE